MKTVNFPQPRKLFIFDIISLTLLFTVVVAITYLSYYFEERGYSSIFGDIIIFKGLSLGSLIAIAFNAGKIVLTYVGANMKFFNKSRFRLVFVRLVLILLSLIMTLFIVAHNFAAPFAKDVMKKRIERIEDVYYQKNLNLENSFEVRKRTLKENYEEQIQRVNDYYSPLINDAREGESLEMDNVDKKTGQWRGSRFGLYEENRIEYQSQLRKATDEITKKFNDDSSILISEFNEEKSKLLDERTGEMSKESVEKYINNFESQNRNLVDSVDLLNKVGVPLKSFHMTFMITLLLMFCIEFLPIVLAHHFFTSVFEHNHKTTEDNSQTINSARIKSEKIDYANTH